ncbi:MAG: type II toxin-antitoxin system RelE/ParE family toxin [Parvularculaceae bacterium]
MTYIFAHESQGAAALGFSEAERAALIDRLAEDPESGVPLGGGLWKVRVARQGKSGGYRTLHFYRRDDMPLFLLSVFAKNEKANISAAEKRLLISICDEIAARYGSKRSKT